MIYAKSAENHPCIHYKFPTIKPLSEANFQPNSIYWYDQHDLSVRMLDMENALNEEHWQHLRSDITTKLLLYFGDEYFNIVDIQMFAATIKKHRINPKQVYLVTVDYNWESWARRIFKDFGVEDVNITHQNVLLSRTSSTDISQAMTHRFSSFSRNYNPWRLRLFAHLCNKNLLPYFNYSFNNIHPYANPMKIIDKDEILNELKKENLTSDNIVNWVSKMPYELPNAPVEHKWAEVTYSTIRSSGVHVLVESHYDPFLHFPVEKEKFTPDYFSPAFLTEKTYKVLFCKKPFIAFTTPYFMKEMREMGFKTFEPYINESYDLELDEHKRLMMIIDEVERLSKLSDFEFQNMLTALDETVKYNFRMISNLKKSISIRADFEWIKQYMDTYISKRALDCDIDDIVA